MKTRTHYYLEMCSGFPYLVRVFIGTFDFSEAIISMDSLEVG